MVFTFQLRRGTSVEWTSKNSVLRSGEPAIEVDTNLLKLGNGITAWNELPYFTPPTTSDDQGSSLTLLYENAKV